MIRVNIYEQDCCGTIHYRVMRNDGQLIFNQHMTDFPSNEEAVAAICGEFRRKKLGTPDIHLYTRGCANVALKLQLEKLLSK